MNTMWEMEDPLNIVESNPAKAQHNRLSRQLIYRAGEPGLMIVSSWCSLFTPCAITEGKPCRFPELQYSCMSAYCIFVEELTKRCGMEYDCGPGVTAFFSMYCFQPRD